MTEETAEKTTEDLISEFYQGEVFGEAFLVELLKRFKGADEQYKIGTLLQLETETKALIRPIAAAYGVDLIELPESRQGGVEAAESVPIEDWRDLMGVLLEPSKDSALQYKAMAEQLPKELSDFAKMMSEHEHALHIFFAEEAAGRVEQSLNPIIEMLQNPLPKPSAVAS